MPPQRIEQLRVSYGTGRRIRMYLAQVNGRGKRRYAAGYAEARLRGVDAWEAQSVARPIGGTQATEEEAKGVQVNIDAILKREPR